MTELVSLIAVLAVVGTGMLLMMQVATPGDIYRYGMSALIVILGVILAWYALTAFWVSVLVPWLESGLASLKALLVWFAVTLIALIAALLVARLALSRFGR